MGVGLIEILLQKRICFAVVAVNVFGDISDNFVTVCEGDVDMVERITGKKAYILEEKKRGNKKKDNTDDETYRRTIRDCRVLDLGGEDYRFFEGMKYRFDEIILDGGIGRVYELKDFSFKQYRNVAKNK